MTFSHKFYPQSKEHNDIVSSKDEVRNVDYFYTRSSGDSLGQFRVSHQYMQLGRWHSEIVH
jgi:hypothetical protein